LLKRIIIGPSYPLRGGISESNQALQNYFEENHQNSKIVSYSLQYPKFLFPGKQQTVDSISSSSSSTFNLINTLNPFSWLKTAYWVINEKPNYVIIRYWHPYFAVCLSLIAKLIRKKSIFIIAWIDNINPHESIPLQKFLTSYFIKSCDAFVVMSKSVKCDLLKYNHTLKNILVCPHPIYNNFGKSIPKIDARKNLGLSNTTLNNNESKYILFFGLIRNYKGLLILLDALAEKNISKLDVKLIIAGEFYDSKEKYCEKINNLGISDRVVLHDFYINNNDVVNYFCASDIVVQPYLAATQSGVSMIAYNFNRPLLLTNVGGLAEYVDHKKNGYLVSPNPKAISSAIEDFYLHNREKPFSDSIKKKKDNYSWKNLAKTFDSLYKL
jgi:D-inositol-3-phosphate glycosyltransferase